MSEQLRFETLVSEAIGEVGSFALRDAKLLSRLLETFPSQRCPSTDRISFGVELGLVWRTVHGASGAVPTGIGIHVESSSSNRHVHCLTETVPSAFCLLVESGLSEEIGCCGIVACRISFMLLCSRSTTCNWGAHASCHCWTKFLQLALLLVLYQKFKVNWIHGWNKKLTIEAESSGLPLVGVPCPASVAGMESHWL